MRIFWLLAVGACACLSAAAIWMGGINQDEGWYLYAANLVSEGKVPYRDFFFTQGPVMPYAYSAIRWAWDYWGLLGARVVTLMIGLVGIVLAALLARKLAEPAGAEDADECGPAGAVVLAMILLLGTNLYHLYFLAMPKTYALASLLATGGMLCLVGQRDRFWAAMAGGLLLAWAAGTRISLGALMPVVGISLLLFRRWKALSAFIIGGMAGLWFSYGILLTDHATQQGIVAAQAYHAARGGFDLTWTVGSFSRLVRWYLPVFIVLGLGIGTVCRRDGGKVNPELWMVLAGFLAVFAVQMAAPFPYEDYQVPVMSLLAAGAVALFFRAERPLGMLLVLGLTFATSFGSPLLEKWSTNGQDRFWSLKKEKYELQQLRDVADKIEQLDPCGRLLFTQDLYLAIETRRKVPKGLEMGPFSNLSDAEWRNIITSAPCNIAAVSGYTFAIEPPKCNERPVAQQLEYFNLLKSRYSSVEVVRDFGQNSTTLLLLKRNK